MRHLNLLIIGPLTSPRTPCTFARGSKPACLLALFFFFFFFFVWRSFEALITLPRNETHLDSELPLFKLVGRVSERLPLRLLLADLAPGAAGAALSVATT